MGGVGAGLGSAWGPSEQQEWALCKHAGAPERQLRVCRHCCTTTSLSLPQKAGLQKRLQELEEQRDAALLEARRWQHAAEEQEAVLVQLQQREQQLPTAASAAVGGSGQEPQGDAVRQLAALHEQLENLAEGGLPALQQERARMSICLQSEAREEGDSAAEAASRHCA